MNSAKQILRRNTAASIWQRHSPAPEFRWLWIGFFILALALLGGSSRPDPMQNAMLRPIAALLLIPALYHLRLADLGRAKGLVTVFGLMMVWMVIQLVPLPPGLWQALPSRDIIAELDQLAGIQGTWRPLSLAPFRGLNAALSMVVPATALLLALSMKMGSRVLLFAIIGIGLIDATFGLLQVIGGPRSPLYLFAIASRGAPAGIFANENHSAVFSALVLLAIARVSLEARSMQEPAWLRLSLAPAFLFVLLDVLVTGSRAGFAATLMALIGASLMTFLTLRERASRNGLQANAKRREARGGLILGLFAGVVAVVMIAFLWLERTPALDDILARSSFEDLRWSLWPVLSTMAEQHWLLGTGFGSFDAIYHLYEPTDLLLPLYVNHAHNDWAQLIIEGGLPAAALLAAGLGWLATSLWTLRRQTAESLGYVIFWIACIAIISAASIVDYPLRTPIFQGVFVWLLVSLILDKERALPEMPTV